MGAVPIVLSGNVFGTIVSIFEVIRCAELLDGFLNAAGAAKFVPAHVMCVRYG